MNKQLTKIIKFTFTHIATGIIGTLILWYFVDIRHNQAWLTGIISSIFLLAVKYIILDKKVFNK